MSRKLWVWIAVLAIAGTVVTAAGASTRVEGSQKLTKVTLQLKWVTQAQFAGYYAAKAKGYYQKAGLDVTIKPGGPNIVPEQVVAGGQAQFGIDWLSSLMLSRAKNVPLVSISQVFNKSGLTLLTWKDTGINTVAKMKGKKVGNWLFGNEFEVFAALAKYGMDPVHNKGVTIFQQPFDMNAFLKRQIDAASAMTYNELAQVLETKDPKHRQALLDEQAQRHQDADRRHVDARGQHLHDDELPEEPRERRDGEEVRRGLAAGVDLVPRSPGRLREDGARERTGAAEGPPDLADERDQRAHLAGVEGDRGHESRRRTSARRRSSRRTAS